MDDIIVGNASGNRGITVVSGDAAFGTLAFGDSTDGSGNDRYQGFVEYYHSENSLRLGTVAQERLRIDSSGCLRIGNTHSQTTSGNTKRIALGAKGSIWGWTSGNINGALTLADNYYWDGANNRAIEADDAAYLSLRSGSLRFGTTDSTPSAGGVTGLTEKFRITSDGKLGVGCTPETDFQVRNGNGGTLKIGGSGTGATGFQIQYNNSGATTTEILTNYRATNSSASLKIDTGKF